MILTFRHLTLIFQVQWKREKREARFKKSLCKEKIFSVLKIIVDSVVKEILFFFELRFYARLNFCQFFWKKKESIL